MFEEILSDFFIKWSRKKKFSHPHNAEVERD